MTSAPNLAQASLLIVDSDIVSRHVIAEYLRDCGFSVLEASRMDDAYSAVREPAVSIDIVLVAVIENDTQEIFKFATWANSIRSDLRVKLVGGVEGAVRAAVGLCKSGPYLNRPYEPQQILDYIKHIRANPG